MLVLYMILYVPSPGPQPIKAGQIVSNHHLKTISLLMLKYRNEHGGNSPLNLKDLIPNDQPDCLKILYVSARNFQKSSDQNSNKKFPEKRFDYVLSVIPGILAYERPGLWPDGSISVCFDDLTVKRLNSTEFSKLVGQHQ